MKRERLKEPPLNTSKKGDSMNYNYIMKCLVLCLLAVGCSAASTEPPDVKPTARVICALGDGSGGNTVSYDLTSWGLGGSFAPFYIVTTTDGRRLRVPIANCVLEEL